MKRASKRSKLVMRQAWPTHWHRNFKARRMMWSILAQALLVLLVSTPESPAKGQIDSWSSTDTDSVHVHFGAGAFKRAFTTTATNDTTGGYLFVVRNLGTEGEVTYEVHVRLSGIQGWFGIEDGESLLLRLDGNRTVAFQRTEKDVKKRKEERKLAIVGQHTASEIPITIYLEEAEYAADADALREVAAAKGAEIRIVGSTRTVTKTLKRKKLRKIRSFLRGR